MVAPRLATIQGETVAERVQRLQSEARRLARDHMAGLLAAMDDLGALATGIAQGGEAYPAGVRDQARRLSDVLGERANAMTVLLERLT